MNHKRRKANAEVVKNSKDSTLSALAIYSRGVYSFKKSLSSRKYYTNKYARFTA